MEIIETAVFTAQAESMWSPEEYRQLQGLLLERPDAGAVIPGSGGLRKVRWGLSGRGKRGGARVIYYVVLTAHQLFLLFAYDKHETEDLTKDQIKRLRALIG